MLFFPKVSFHGICRGNLSCLLGCQSLHANSSRDWFCNTSSTRLVVIDVFSEKLIQAMFCDSIKVRAPNLYTKFGLASLIAYVAWEAVAITLSVQDLEVDRETWVRSLIQNLDVEGHAFTTTTIHRLTDSEAELTMRAYYHHTKQVCPDADEDHNDAGNFGEDSSILDAKFEEICSVIVRAYDEGFQFCRFTSGRFGWVPDTSKAGDVVCMAFGSKVPFALRSYEPQLVYDNDSLNGDHFTMLGTACVHGVMDGELFEDEEGVLANANIIYLH